MPDLLLALVAWLTTLLGSADEAPECLVLGRLDVVRAAAFTRDEPALLDDVYADPALRERDRRVLDAYRERDLRLVGLGLHRVACRVVSRADGTVVLDVTDRLGPTWVVRDGERRALPRDGGSRRTVTLRRDDVGWRVASSTDG